VTLRDSPGDFRVSPAQPHRENPAKCEEQLAREVRTALLECGELVRSHRRNLAIVHRPCTSRPGSAVEKRELSQH
jgi:hypothetical protein